MDDLLSKFMKKYKKLNKHVDEFYNENEIPIKEINKDFNNFIFKIKFLDYINKTLNFTNKEYKRKLYTMNKNEKLILNECAKENNTDYMYNIEDKSFDLIKEVYNLNESIDFKEIVNNLFLLKEIMKLTERQKLILYKCVIEEKTDTAVAEELNVTQQAVSKTKKKILDKLRKTLEVRKNDG